MEKIIENRQLRKFERRKLEYLEETDEYIINPLITMQIQIETK